MNGSVKEKAVVDSPVEASGPAAKDDRIFEEAAKPPPGTMPSAANSSAGSKKKGSSQTTTGARSEPPQNKTDTKKGEGTAGPGARRPQVTATRAKKKSTTDASTHKSTGAEPTDESPAQSKPGQTIVVEDLFEGVANTLGSGLGFVIDKGQSVVGGVIHTGQRAVGSVVHIGKSALGGVVSGVSSGVGWVGGLLRNVRGSKPATVGKSTESGNKRKSD